MQRRRSRDPNVADRLVVELDDGDHRHTSPPKSDKSRSTSPDHAAPPPYSTLPPPYSPAKKHVLVEKEEVLLVPRPKPSRPSPSSSSTSHKKVSTSELRVLVFLYRTVVYGLEMRNRKDMPELKPPPRPTSPTKKKPLGPRSSPRLIPEDKGHFETALAAASAKAGRTSKGGFAVFPLVEDDLDSESKEYVTPSTPFHSPSQSPRSSPPPFLRSSPSLDALSAKPKKEKTKAEVNAELHVQDALLALRLKEFLRAQGVCEEDLRVDFDEEGRLLEKEMSIEKEPVVQVQQEEDEETNILDEYFMGIEEEDHGAAAKKHRGPVVEDDDVIAQDSPFIEEDDLDMDMDDSSASSPPPLPLPTLRVATLAQRISSPPPASPSPRPHAVLPTSYMVALLTMRNRHPSKKPGSSSSGSGSSGNEKGKVKRRSGLSVVVEVD